MRFRLLKIYALIALALIGGELMLEVRANLRGYRTILFGSPSEPLPAQGEARRWGPTEGFPFRSFIVDSEKPPATIRIWIASASYAEDTRFPVDEVFPTRLGEILSDALSTDVQVLNASAAGKSISDNVYDLARTGPLWDPDVAILYQMTNDLNELANPSSDPGPSVNGSRNPFDQLTRWYQATTLYEQLRANLTPIVTSRRLLSDSPPAEADSAFLARATAFVDQARALGVRPILLTFATSTGSEYDLSPIEVAFTMRWNSGLSSEGYVQTVRRWNDVIRELGGRYDVEVVDMAAAMSGERAYFRDLAHFTADGHLRFAEILSEALAGPVGGVTGQ